MSGAYTPARILKEGVAIFCTAGVLRQVLKRHLQKLDNKDTPRTVVFCTLFTLGVVVHAPHLVFNVRVLVNRFLVHAQRRLRDPTHAALLNLLGNVANARVVQNVFQKAIGMDDVVLEEAEVDAEVLGRNEAEVDAEVLAEDGAEVNAEVLAEDEAEVDAEVLAQDEAEVLSQHEAELHAKTAQNHTKKKCKPRMQAATKVRNKDLPKAVEQECTVCFEVTDKNVSFCCARAFVLCARCRTCVERCLICGNEAWVV